METIEKVRISFQEMPKGLYATMQNTEKYLKESGLQRSLFELIKIRASQINKCGYCLDMHHKDAISAGETFQRLYLLPAWEESPCFTEEEKAVLNLTDRLTEISKQSARGIEEAYERVSQYYSKTQIANIVLAITQINAWNRIAITFGNIPGSYNR
jgi:AhpD family alkylhydroperoxidase